LLTYRSNVSGAVYFGPLYTAIAGSGDLSVGLS